MSVLFLTIAVIFTISIVMAMVGRGGGNFYVPALVATGISVLQAATTAQLILFITALSALLMYGKHKTVDWKLALVIDPPTDIMAFVGGYFAHRFSSTALKFTFSGLLVLLNNEEIFLYDKNKTRHSLGRTCEVDSLLISGIYTKL